MAVWFQKSREKETLLQDSVRPGWRLGGLFSADRQPVPQEGSSTGCPTLGLAMQDHSPARPAASADGQSFSTGQGPWKGLQLTTQVGG